MVKILKQRGKETTHNHPETNILKHKGIENGATHNQPEATILKYKGIKEEE